MASRRDELNAYTFAKKRLVAQFLQPSPTGTEEGAPRPLRAVVPGLVIGALVLAGFGAWGMFKPHAPKGWDEPEKNVIIASKSTTRYVVLETDHKAQLHPVLNLTSAKLLLGNAQGQNDKPLEVDEDVLDSGKLPHGATLGIPYAPDRLPAPKEAGKQKRWAVCETPGKGGEAIQKAAFVLADREKGKVEGEKRLHGGQLMYVRGPGGDQYIVDREGRKYPLAEDSRLLRAIVGYAKPQRVSKEWLATLHDGDRITFPTVDGRVGATAGASEGLDPRYDKVGTLLKARVGAGTQHYLVVPGAVRTVSDFTARLLLSSPQLVDLGQNGKAIEISDAEIPPGATKEFAGGLTWPKDRPTDIVSGGQDGRDTVCNVLRGVNRKGGTTLSTWSGTSFPATLPAGSTSAYVTPGSGQFYRQVQGTDTKSGGTFLVTDTGLRYAMQSNSDSGKDKSEIGRGNGKQKDTERAQREQQESKRAQTLLGYGATDPLPVPIEWSEFLPTGPRLSVGSALQPQGS